MHGSISSPEPANLPEQSLPSTPGPSLAPEANQHPSNMVPLAQHNAALDRLTDQYEKKIAEMQRNFEEARIRQERMFELQRREFERQTLEKGNREQEAKLAQARAQIVEEERFRAEQLEKEIGKLRDNIVDLTNQLHESSSSSFDLREAVFKQKLRIETLEEALTRKIAGSVAARRLRKLLLRITVKLWAKRCEWRRIILTQLLPELRGLVSAAHTHFTGREISRRQCMVTDEELNDMREWLCETDLAKQLVVAHQQHNNPLNWSSSSSGSFSTLSSRVARASLDNNSATSFSSPQPGPSLGLR